MVPARFALAHPSAGRQRRRATGIDGKIEPARLIHIAHQPFCDHAGHKTAQLWRRPTGFHPNSLRRYPLLCSLHRDDVAGAGLLDRASPQMNGGTWLPYPSPVCASSFTVTPTRPVRSFASQSFGSSPTTVPESPILSNASDSAQESSRDRRLISLSALISKPRRFRAVSTSRPRKGTTSVCRAGRLWGSGNAFTHSAFTALRYSSALTSTRTCPTSARLLPAFASSARMFEKANRACASKPSAKRPTLGSHAHNPRREEHIAHSRSRGNGHGMSNALEVKRLPMRHFFFTHFAKAMPTARAPG